MTTFDPSTRLDHCQMWVYPNKASRNSEFLKFAWSTLKNLSQGADALFEPKPCPIEEEVASRGTEVEVKSEIPDSEIDVSLLFGQERSGAMVSSSGIVLSETVMDELLRMVGLWAQSFNSFTVGDKFEIEENSPVILRAWPWIAPDSCRSLRWRFFHATVGRILESERKPLCHCASMQTDYVILSIFV